MLSNIGSIIIGFALVSNLFAIGAIWFGIRNHDNRWWKSGKRAFNSTTTLLLIALLLLIIAFLTNQFQLNYVAQHSNRNLPFYLKISAIWAGQEGSLLLWAFLQALFTSIIAQQEKKEEKLRLRWALIILGAISFFFNAMTLIFSNPFITSGTMPFDGQGMNPLLRHPGMIFHPPILYVGYVGLAVPFAFAIASLITNKVNKWFLNIRQWLLISWLALGIGIILGSRWAYDVLGWGGYWGWDAVENAGLMPWLTATALLHSISEQKRNKGFKIWNLILAVLSFVLVLFGTFATRSGLIQSVHAFTRSPIGPYFLGLIGLVLIGSFLILIVFRNSLGEVVYPEKVLSREGISFITLILLLLITFSILLGTILPSATNGRISATADWFNRVVGPQLGLLVLLIGVCPIFGSFGRSIKTTKWRVVAPIIGLILLPLIACLSGMQQVISLIGFAVVGFAGGVIISELLHNLKKEQIRTQDNTNNSASKRWKFQKFGGLLVHFGVILITLGVIGTQIYSTDQNVSLSPGDLIEVGEYKLFYEDLFQEIKTDQIVTWAEISVYRDDSFLDRLKPQIAYYPAYDQPTAEPAIHSSILEDLYLVMFQWQESGTISVNVMINPLSSFLWIGGLILVIGGLFAWCPVSLPQNKGSSRKQKSRNNLFVIIAIVITLILFFTLWGKSIISTSAIGRPLPGEFAPGFKAADIKGNLISLNQYQGKLVVLHFWASWCPQCEEELIQFENQWKVSQNQEVEFIGVAMNDDKNNVTQIASELNITFTLVPDPDGRISRSYGVTAVPETYIIRPDGTIENFYIGVIDQSVIKEELELNW